MLNVTIDGVSVAVKPGTTIIEAAKQAGVLVPHYCYHPSLPSPAVCRMCLVEVEKSPKLVPSCVTTVAEGQVVHTQSAQALKARQGVLEFLLINHPLDCPICDQAGECELQDYVFQEGRAGTRYADYPKRYNPVETFGPDVLYVANRCILCTRCVRFMDSVAQQPVLNVSDRGDRAYIGIDPRQPLDHEWAGNVVDLCPVGSLISRDFLHKARAWDLDRTASICPGCTQGCNITVDMRDEAVVRFRPRANLDVNRHFICDTGRMTYRQFNRGDRAEAPLLPEGGRLAAVDWDVALDRVASLLAGATGSAVILASGRASLESLGLVRELTRHLATTAAVHVPLGPVEPLAGVPGLALRAERAPNLRGAEWLGYTADLPGALAAAAAASVVIVLDLELDEAMAGALAGVPASVIALSTLEPEGLRDAAAILPVTTMLEENGTFANRDGRVQRFQAARGGPGMARPAWWVAAQILGRTEDAWLDVTTADEALVATGRRHALLAGLTYRELGFTGRVPDAAPVQA